MTVFHLSETDRTGGLTIPSMFRLAASGYREKPAVYDGEHLLTYGQLDEMSDRIACGLKCLGVKNGDRVMFLLKRDYRLIPAILGISKAGASFVPAYPAECISYIIKDSQSVMLISSQQIKTAEKYYYTEIDKLLCTEAEPELLPDVNRENLACMIYYPGAAGCLKRVMVSHRQITEIVNPDSPSQREAAASVFFDILLSEIFVPLMNGRFVGLGRQKP